MSYNWFSYFSACLSIVNSPCSRQEQLFRHKSNHVNPLLKILWRYFIIFKLKSKLFTTTTKVLHNLTCIHIPTWSGHGLSRTHSTGVTCMDWTIGAVSWERPGSMSRKTVQISNRSGVQALVLFQSASIAESVFSLPSQVFTWPSALHTVTGPQNYSFIGPCFKSPLSHPVPSTKGL